jgi:hypothetical protein
MISQKLENDIKEPKSQASLFHHCSITVASLFRHCFFSNGLVSPNTPQGIEKE